jgi:hypothetical protein
VIGDLLDDGWREIAAEGMAHLAALGLGAEEQDGRGAEIYQDPDQ